MVERFHLIDKDIPIYFLHGERSWMDVESSNIARSTRELVFVETMKNVGHHVRHVFCPSASSHCLCYFRYMLMIQLNSTST